MPLVHAYVACRWGTWWHPLSKGIGALPGKLLVACDEVIPAALNSVEGPLTPGSIEFIPHLVYHKGLKEIDVLITVEAYDYADRVQNIESRAEAIRVSMEMLIPGKKFAVWISPCNAGWSSRTSDPDFVGDMSMRAAFERAAWKLLDPYGRLNKRS
jgi:hypothetical protein